MNNKKYLARLKTIEELVAQDPNNNDYEDDEECEIYQIIKKYGGKKITVYEDATNKNYSSVRRYRSKMINNDKELNITDESKFFYEDELDFLSTNIFHIDDKLFKL